jgi:hypothetical protein
MMLCKIRVGMHWHHRLPGLWCIGTGSLGRPWGRP